MAKVIANMSMSLDGYIADPDDNVEHLFDWYFGGEIVVPSAHSKYSFRTTSEASAAHLREALSGIGALAQPRLTGCACQDSQAFRREPAREATARSG